MGRCSGGDSRSLVRGSDGANAVGNVLFGSVNPSGKLPNTFPKSEADLPHPTVTKPPPGSDHFNGPVSPEQWAAGLPPFQATTTRA